MGGVLTGARVLLTRSPEDSGELTRRIGQAGGGAICVPMIRIAPPEDPEPLRRVRENLSAFRWLVLTSRHGAARILEGLRPVADLDIAAVGESTARAIRDLGWSVAHVSSGKGGAALAVELSAMGVSGETVLYATSDLGGDELPERLRDAGVRMTVVEAYRTLPPEPSDPSIERLVRDVEGGRHDIAVFASPSAVRNFAGLFVTGGAYPAGLPAVAIGATTEKALKQAGARAVTKAARPDAAGLFEAVVAAWTGYGSRRSVR